MLASIESLLSKVLSISKNFSSSNHVQRQNNKKYKKGIDESCLRRLPNSTLDSTFQLK